MTTLYNTVREIRNRFPGKAAVVGDYSDLTYDELLLRSDILAADIRRHAARPKDRICIVHGSGVNLVASVLASLQTGCYAVPLDPRDCHRLSSERTANGRPPLVITDTETLAATEELRTHPKDALIVMEMTELRRDLHHEELAAERQRSPFSENNGGIAFYPRGERHNSRGIAYDANLISRLIDLQVEQSDLRNGLREYIAATLPYHFSLLQLLTCLAEGGTAILSPDGASAPELTKRIYQNRCNALAVPMDVLRHYVKDTESLPESTAAQIRLITVHDPSLTVSEKKLILKRFPNAHLRLLFGIPEAPLISWIDYRTAPDRMRTIGRPVDLAEVRVVDDHGRQSRRAEAGEIVVRGKLLASAYLDGTGLHPLLAEGVEEFRTGDIVHTDAKGYLAYVGRKEELITRGHRKIAPQQIEEQLREVYPQCEICVVGIPDPEGGIGEVPVLCYSARNGEMIIPSELTTLLSRHLDRTLIPRVVFRIPSFPRVENRISRHELKNMILAGDYVS